MIRLILTALFLVFECQFSFADMGAIVPVASVSVNEPGQKAIVAHDGFEEILILATDLKTSQKAKVIRFIPFPSEPKVSLASKNCFKVLEKIVKKHHLSYLVHYKMMGGRSFPISVRFYQKIGPHEVTVVKVNDISEFNKWINTFFSQHGLPQRKITAEESKVINIYLQKGFSFFVFDVVDLDVHTKSVIPLLFRFKTRYFYYPLLTSNMMKGKGTITLFVLSDRGDFQRPFSSGPWRSSTTALLSQQELENLSPEIFNLMGKHALLQVFQYRGKLHFNEDIWFGIPVHETRPYYPKLPKPQ